jgi:cytolysin-activating lysine-acyltransferase
MTYRRGLKLSYSEKLGNKTMEKLGVVASLMANSPQYSRYPLVSLKAWIHPALQTEQLAIFYDANSGEAVGYITWAMLAPDVERRWLRQPDVLLHLSEWNEGFNLWIMDFLSLPGYCEDIIEYIKESMFLENLRAYSLRRDKNGKVRKVTCWDRAKFTSGLTV